jgi:dihydrofolate reductase
LLLGRVTFEAFAAAWPSMTDEEGFAERMNSLPKYVASTTLKEPLAWNGRLIKGNLAQEVLKLKQQPGQNILVSGGAGLVHSLMKLDLIDEYRLLVYPIVRGSGKRFFTDGGTATLNLTDTKSMGANVVLLTYQSAHNEDKK